MTYWVGQSANGYDSLTELRIISGQTGTQREGSQLSNQEVSHTVRQKRSYFPAWLKAVIAFDPAGKASFVYSCRQTRVMGQYNGNQYVSKPLTIVITVAGMRLVSPFCYSHILHFLRARVIDEGARKNWLDPYSVEVFCDFVFFIFHCFFCLRQENKRMTMFPDDHLRESVSRLGEDLRCR